MGVGILERGVLEAPSKLASVDAGLQRVQVMSQPIDACHVVRSPFRHAYAVVLCRKCAAAGVDRDILAAQRLIVAPQLNWPRNTEIEGPSQVNCNDERTLGEQGATH